jgi:hypothetical protein
VLIKYNLVMLLRLLINFNIIYTFIGLYSTKITGDL